MLRPRPSPSAAARLALLLAALFAVAGCWQSVSSDEATPGAGDDDDSVGLPPPFSECTVDLDCVPAATSCCDCPAYALPGESYGDPCGDVECPAPASCPGLAPACTDGACTLVCAPVPCDLVCGADGFVQDAAGCLQCACGTGPGNPPDRPDRCDSDDDCVAVPADCCGCALGGADTAVPVGVADAFHEGLECDPMPSCPGVNVCDPAAVARCIGSACTLSTESTDGGPDGGTGGDGGGAALLRCGTLASPTCPEGSACILNHPAAAEAGIFDSGICVPAGG
jgi:hypothetical protein